MKQFTLEHLKTPGRFIGVSLEDAMEDDLKAIKDKKLSSATIFFDNLGLQTAIAARIRVVLCAHRNCERGNVAKDVGNVPFDWSKLPKEYTISGLQDVMNAALVPTFSLDVWVGLSKDIAENTVVLTLRGFFVFKD